MLNDVFDWAVQGGGVLDLIDQSPLAAGTPTRSAGFITVLMRVPDGGETSDAEGVRGLRAVGPLPRAGVT
jgi:hypothetical protein